MNNTEKQLIELIKESQFGNGILSFSDWDFGAVMKEAKAQAVLGVVAPVIPKGYVSDSKVVDRIIAQQKAQYIRYLHKEDQLKRLLDENDIPFVILKGNAAAMYYREPSYRKMGDIDFLINVENFARTKEVMLNSGYELKHDADTEDYRHIAFAKEKISFELHRKFSHEVDIEEYVLNGLARREIKVIEGYEFPVLPNLANGLVLLDHMRNHLKTGLGLRQVIDWMMYVNAELNDEFWNAEFGPVAREKGFEMIATVTTKMCRKYLGLSERITWCESADEELCDSLMESLLEYGNFGRKKGKGNNIETVSTAFKSEGFFRRLQRAGEYNWKACKKHHWLKPFAWIYQAFRYAGRGVKTKRNRKQLKEDMQRGKERYELLKKLEIF